MSMAMNTSKAAARFSAAVGMAVRRDGEDSKAVFERADQAMYKEKVAMHALRN